MQQHCSCVLTTLARVGNRDEAAAAAAFAAGAKFLNEQKTEFAFLPATQCTGPALEGAFAALDATSPLINKKLLAACLECIMHDQVVQVDGIELFAASPTPSAARSPPRPAMNNQSEVESASAMQSATSWEVWDAQQPQ